MPPPLTLASLNAAQRPPSARAVRQGVPRGADLRTVTVYDFQPFFEQGVADGGRDTVAALRFRRLIWEPYPADPRDLRDLVGSTGGGSHTQNYARLREAVGQFYADATAGLCASRAAVAGRPRTDAFRAACAIVLCLPGDAVGARLALDKWSAAAQGTEMPDWWDDVAARL